MEPVGRREFLTTAVSLVGILARNNLASASEKEVAVKEQRKLQAKPTLPGAAGITFIDAHEHIEGDLAPEAMIAVMDRLGVSKIVAMARARGVGTTAQLALNAYKKYSDRVIPFVGLNFMDAITDDILEDLDRQLSPGIFQGIGELHGRHYAFPIPERIPVPAHLRKGRDITIPMDSPGVQDIMRLAAKYNVVVVVHMETTKETVPGLEQALQRNPNTRVIWAHQTHVKSLGGPALENARKAEPGQIATLMARYPNLYADIAPGYERLYFTEQDRLIPEQWRNLYEQYSDRFVVGLDNPFLEMWEDTPGHIGITIQASFIRDWLSQLSLDTQRKMASENIQRILAAKPASSRDAN